MMNFISINQLKQQKHLFKRIRFRVQKLDELTNGGIDIRNLTEIYGEPGSGKTQVCLQLTLNTQLPEEYGGLNRKVVYIQTESLFPIKRLNQMIEKIRTELPIAKNIDFLNNLFLNHVIEVDDLVNCIQKDLIALFQKMGSEIGLIVVDSIGMFRTETEDFIKRAEKMNAIKKVLINLASHYEFAVVIVNQVSSIENDAGQHVIIPALGDNWVNRINTRLQISNKTQYREMSVVFSSRLPKSKAPFILTEEGVRDYEF